MITSSLSHQEIPKNEAVQGCDIREGIFKLIQSQSPDFSNESYISMEELNHYRRLYLTKLTEDERGELNALDLDVMRAIRENSLLSENVTTSTESQQTLGQRAADKIASFGGSWTFVISFFLFLSLWILTNIWFLKKEAFDPYPFILLNLLLSCIAAIQAPIIMMSQNRQEQKDRIRAEQDYKINFKAELEIKLLSEKIDHLILHQNKKLLEIQEVQIDYLEDLLKYKNETNPPNQSSSASSS